MSTRATAGVLALILVVALVTGVQGASGGFKGRNEVRELVVS